MKNVNFNGTLALKSEVRLELDNRSFLYGDGIFETIKVTQKNILLWDLHWDRLQRGMSILNFNFENIHTQNYFERLIIQLLKENNLKEARVKIIVWRKPGGLFSPISNEADFIIFADTFNNSPLVKSNVKFSRDVKSDYSLLSAYKTTSSLKYILAGIEVKKNMLDDVILFNKEGYISECLTSNVFWSKNNIIYTPDILCGCIDGVFRRKLLSEFTKSEVGVQIGFFKANEILDSDFIFTTNIAGPSVIKTIEGRSFGDIPKQINSILHTII